MTVKNITNQTIALAGIAQSCYLVHHLATQGVVDDYDAMEASIRSILKIDADSVVDVYGDLASLSLGLEQFQRQITGRDIGSPQQARYAASLVFLENKLNNRPDLIELIQTGVTKAQSQAETFGILHENVFAGLGDLYQNTISTIEPRIMVQGEQEYLSQPGIANKIRALLLAGVRAAMLWKQCGGSRWKFLFYRKKLQDETQFLLSQI